MMLEGWKLNIILIIAFVLYLVIGGAIYYGFDSNVAPPEDPMMNMVINKVATKTMTGLDNGVTQALPMVMHQYKAKTGKENFTDQDVETIVKMTMDNVKKAMKEKMEGKSKTKSNGHTNGHTDNGHSEAEPSTNETAPVEASNTEPSKEEEEAKAKAAEMAANEADDMEAEIPSDTAGTDDTPDAGTDDTNTVTEAPAGEKRRKKRQAVDVTTVAATTAETTVASGSVTTEASGNKPAGNNGTTPTEAPAKPDNNDEDDHHKPSVLQYIFFVFQCITTIGYGNLTPRSSGSQFFCMIYTSLGIPLFFVMTWCLVFALKSAACGLTRKMTGAKMTWRKRNIIRMLVSLLLGFIVFILIAGAIFASIEGWKYVAAIYFAYSTITSIGFGDFYPGLMMGLNEDPTQVNTAARAFYMIFVVLYTIFGISWVLSLAWLIIECFLQSDDTKDLPNGDTPNVVVEKEMAPVARSDNEEKKQPLLKDTAANDTVEPETNDNVENQPKEKDQIDLEEAA